MTRVFIDGKSGTTGLRLAERLAGRADIELLALPEERRRDPEARAEMLNAAFPEAQGLLLLPEKVL